MNQTARALWGTSIHAASTVPEVFFARCALTPGMLAYRFHVGRGWRDVTWGAFQDRVHELAAGLLTLDLKPGDRVGIIGETRPEWGTTDLAVLCCGAVSVGLYQTSTPQQWAHILNDAQVEILFVDHGARLEGLRLVRDQLPALRHVVVWDAPAGLDAAQGELSLFELMTTGRKRGKEGVEQVTARSQVIAPGAPANLVYTSGTTGPPKGATLTHDNVLAMLMTQMRQAAFKPGDITLSFLPMCHVAEKVVSFYGRMVYNVATAYARSLDFQQILEDIQAVQPTVFGAVPRVFEKVYARARMRAAEKGKGALRVFDWACKVGFAHSRARRGLEPMTPWLRWQHSLADRLVFEKVRALFGGRVRFFLSGAAPISVEVLEFFHAAGMLILEAYGMTESTAIATANSEEHFRFGSVGKPIEGVRLRLAEDGEILLQGRTIFSGYHNKPGASARAVDKQGWLHTGDIGRLDEEGFVYIVDRKKNIIITAGGKNIAPQHIENRVKDDPYVSHCVVIGDRRPFLTALLTLDMDEAPHLTRSLGIAFRDASRLAEDPAVVAYMQEVIDRTNAQLGQVEAIKRFRILPRDLSIDSGELTPTLKTRRSRIEERWAELIEAMYHSPAPEEPKENHGNAQDAPG